MGKVGYDEGEHASVQLASGKLDAGALDELIASIEHAASAGNDRGRTMQWLAVVDDAAEPPSTLARRRIAEAMRRFDALDCATVVTSPLQRAVVTAFTWLRPARRNHRYAVFDTEAAAIAWLEELSRPRPVWQRLLREVRDDG